MARMESKMLMGFPVIPFRLCDFWGIHEEKMDGGIFQVKGTLLGGTQAVAMFQKQETAKGSWTAFILREV